MSESVEIPTSPAVPLHRGAGRRDRAALAGLLGGERDLPRAQPDRRAGRPGPPAGRRAEAVRAGHVPVPVRRRAARRAPAGLHRHRRVHPLPADGRLQRAAPDGLRRVRPARRAVRGADRHAPADHHRGQHRAVPRRSCAGWAWPTTSGASFATTDPEYYRWTQWIFLQIFNSWYDADGRQGPADRRADRRVRRRRAGDPGRAPWAELTAVERRTVVDDHRLAYVSEAPVNWCPGLGTVLANEEVTADGRSERGNFPVFKRSLTQWMMRITAYADRLLDDLDPLDWPESVKLMQRNWIGRSTGAHVDFPVGGGAEITVFTTRPDTLFGATYMVLAPEHPLVDAPDPGGLAGRHQGRLDRRRTRRPAEAVAAYRAVAGGEDRRGAARRRQGQDRRLHRRVRDQPGQRRAAAGLHRRLRADRLRHRRDHGGARPGRAGLGVRRGLRPADRPYRAAARGLRRQGLHRRRPGDQQPACAWTAWASPRPRPR